jgi:hypothetical protein
VMARGKRLPAPRCRAYPALGGEFDANPRSWNFPPKQKMWGYRRYLPAVKAWFDQKYGLGRSTSK